MVVFYTALKCGKLTPTCTGYPGVISRFQSERPAAILARFLPWGAVCWGRKLKAVFVETRFHMDSAHVGFKLNRQEPTTVCIGAKTSHKAARLLLEGHGQWDKKSALAVNFVITKSPFIRRPVRPLKRSPTLFPAIAPHAFILDSINSDARAAALEVTACPMAIIGAAIGKV